MNKLKSLSPFTIDVLINKATERPFTGQYNESHTTGTYLCHLCGLALFRSSNKFLSSCGWPSFDDEIVNAIKRLPDSDGRRTEIVCARCSGHLGHVFINEGLTAKNTRHCVNSVSIDFVDSLSITDSEEAIIAGGCFWGVEHHLQLLKGVVKTEVGYIGDDALDPTYSQVCSGQTQFIEAARVVFDPSLLDYSSLIKRFFEIHDPTQHNAQGPDLGHQYQSAIFYHNNQQHAQAQELVTKLETKGLKIATQLRPMQVFWPAEESHQQYYQKNHATPYCHTRVKRFD